jgi:hypothetical protein
VPFVARTKPRLAEFVSIVDKRSRDNSGTFDAGRDSSLTCSSARACNVESRNRSTGGEHKTVNRIASIKVDSHDIPCRIDGGDRGSLIHACACA